MAVQRQHRVPYPTVVADELPAGVPGPARRVVTGNRDAGGRLVAGKETSEFSREAALQKAEGLRLRRLLGRVDLADDHPVAPYRKDASDWRDEHLRRLAETIGGGEVGPAVAAIISSAALQHAASRWLFDRAAVEQNAKMALDASRLADASRQNILAAHEICAREAQARPRQPIDLARALGPMPSDEDIR